MTPVVAPRPAHPAPARFARWIAALVVLVSLSACAEGPVAPVVGSGDQTATSNVVAQTFTSGTHVQTWNAIPEFNSANWETTICGQPPKVGLNANWQNPHNAFVVSHPWQGSYFTAPWINAWNHNGSNGGNPTAPHHNWTKYSTPVSGNGSFVIRLLADNCSWIYIDGTLVGVQGTNLAANSYGLTLNGTHTLEFIIFDGGGAAGGKFILETTTTPLPPLNNDLDGDGHANTVDAFPLDPAEWADSDGDGVGDNADAFPGDAAESVDSDGDGEGDNGDNCPAVTNASQADLDNDGVGDACDLDIDDDGVSNAYDAFPTNPAESVDSDGDGVGNNADAFDNSNTGPALVVGTCNPGVGNWRISGGTWANDLIASAHAAAANHGAFVSAVSELSNSWKKAGLITGKEHGAIVSCAARTK